MKRRTKALLVANQQSRMFRFEDYSNYDVLIMTHPDSDHAQLLEMPHHGTVSAPHGLSPSVLYLHGSGLSQVEPPKFAEYVLLCFVPRKNREYLLGCLEEEFRTILLPKYG